jgi:hypothetical protein
MFSIQDKLHHCALFLLLSMIFGCSGELASKPEWSALQAVEQEYRGKPFTEPEILEIHGHHVLGVQGNDGQRIWILLNPQASPFYKQMPQGPFELSLDLLTQVKTSGYASETVLECLTSHVSVSELKTPEINLGERDKR